MIVGNIKYLHNYNTDDAEFSNWMIGIATVIVLSVFMFFTGRTDGMGAVVHTPLSYSKQLHGGYVYTLLAEEKDGESYILMVRSGKHNFRTIRVKGKLPPTHFMLANGKPVEVTPATGK